MSDDKENIKEEAAADNQNSLIGVDPLAWLSDEEKAAIANQKNEAPEEELPKEENQSSAEVVTDSVYTVQLSNALTIRDISELIQELSNIGDDKNELVFESEQVERVDAAAMQLLLGFYIFAVDAGKKVIWQKPSEALCNAVELLGLNEIIDISAAAN